MTVLQIIALCVLGAGGVTALGFTLAFVVESVRKESPERESKQEVVRNEEVEEINLEEMLARLEEASSKKEEKKEEIKVEDVPVEKVEEKPQETVVEIVEEPKVEEEPQQESQVVEVAEDAIEEEVEPVEEVVETYEEEVQPVIIEKQVEGKNAPEFDYRVRIEKIKESQVRIDRDLDKTTRAILKYERTIRRKDRNQKMLDRRALELTNLNLLMYSVTDIKNVDAEKKARQEELTAHIAELKASIQDAENYIEANKEKHENNLKLRDYLSHEKKRYADEIAELEALIASGKYFDETDGSNGENNN